MELDLIVEVRAWNMKFKWMVRYLCHRCVWARRGSQAFEKANNRSVSEDRPRQILEGEDMKNTGPGVIITMHAIKLLFSSEDQPVIRSRDANQFQTWEGAVTVVI